jgi:predicted ribosomally synthesized peptide with nif11-like leader
MSQEQLLALIEMAKANAVLQEKLREATNLDELTSIVETAGIDIDFNEPTAVNNDLTKNELESAAGGLKIPVSVIWSIGTYALGCIYPAITAAAHCQGPFSQGSVNI